MSEPDYESCDDYLPQDVIGLQTADLASSEALENGMHSEASFMDFEYEHQLN